MNAAVQRQRNEAQFERRLAVEGPVTLDVSLRAGRVRIRRGDDQAVIVRGVLRARHSILSWIHPEEQVHHLALNPPVEQIGNTIRIGDVGDRWLLRRVHFLIEVLAPAGTRVRALGDSADFRIEGIGGPVDCETDSGEIHIEKIDAQVSASADSGDIYIREVSGPVDAEADSGDIEALEIAGGIDAHTDSGRIRLSQVKAAPIYAHSDSGNVTVKLADGGYTIRVRTDGGQIEAPRISSARQSTHELEGVIGEGGSVVAIETDSGDVEIV